MYFSASTILIFVVCLGIIIGSLFIVDNCRSVRQSKPKKCKIAFGGCARNIDSYLSTAFNNMYTLAKHFTDNNNNNDYKIVIYHNDSHDNTLAILKSYESRDPDHVIIIDRHDPSESRIKRLARGRNLVLETIQRECSDYDYFFNVDLDDRFPVLAKNNFQHVNSLLKRNDWDVLSFNQRHSYYDIYALRTNEDPENCWSDHLKGSEVYRLTVKYHQLFNQGDPSTLIPVISAFGGFGIYRLSKTINCKYESEDEQGKEDCEHVSFHRNMRTLHHANIFVVPIEMS